MSVICYNVWYAPTARAKNILCLVLQCSTQRFGNWEVGTNNELSIAIKKIHRKLN